MTSPKEDDHEATRRLGTWVREKYRLDRVIGVGGMAIVFAATHRNKKRVAVKMLKAAYGASVDVQRRFLREGYMANSVDHPGAVSVLDDDRTEDGAAFLVMELLLGAPVDVLATSHAERLGLSATLNIASQLLDTLSAAHEKGLVHRDIKPANLFLTRSGQLKVLDFGIARLRDADAAPSKTQTGTAFGTPAYMGPEQALGKMNEVDARSDVWAVGATIFSLLTGREVHLGETSRHVMVLAATEPAPLLASVSPDVPPSVAALVDRALAFDKNDRWPSAAAMRDAVDEAYKAIFARPPSPTDLVPLLPAAPPERVSQVDAAELALDATIAADDTGCAEARVVSSSTALDASAGAGARSRSTAPVSSDRSTNRPGPRAAALWGAMGAIVLLLGLVSVMAASHTPGRDVPAGLVAAGPSTGLVAPSPATAPVLPTPLAASAPAPVASISTSAPLPAESAHPAPSSRTSPSVAAKASASHAKPLAPPAPSANPATDFDRQ